MENTLRTQLDPGRQLDSRPGNLSHRNDQKRGAGSNSGRGWSGLEKMVKPPCHAWRWRGTAWPPPALDLHDRLASPRLLLRTVHGAGRGMGSAFFCVGATSLDLAS